MKLKNALFITDPAAKILHSIRRQQQEISKHSDRIKRVATLTVLGTLKNVGPTFPTDNLESRIRSVRTLFHLFQFKPFPWIINGICIPLTNLLALAQQNFSDAMYQFIFQPLTPKEVICPINQPRYLLFMSTLQTHVYRCTGNEWSGLLIKVGVGSSFEIIVTFF